MKIFLKIFCLAIIIYFAVSCVPIKMQIVSFQSNNVAMQDTLTTYKDSLMEVWINFYKENGNTIFVLANSNKKFPVFIDLKNSFIAIDNYVEYFWKDESTLKGNIDLYQNKSLPNVFTKRPINATISQSNRIVMIAPETISAINPRLIIKQNMYSINNLPKTIDTVDANWTSKKILTKITSVKYSEANSPTKLRFFLSICRKENFDNPTYIDLKFWVNEIMEMDERQATKSAYADYYYTGAYSLGINDKNSTYHPFKKSYRFYLNNTK